MNTHQKYLCLVYEIEQVPELELRLQTGEELIVIALDYEVELEMKKKGIHFTSLKELAVSPEEDLELIERTRHMVHAWYTLPELKFFQYDGILLGEQYEGPLLYYFQMLFYYLVIIGQVFDAICPDRVVVPESSQYISDTADPSDFFKNRLPVDVARFLSLRRGVQCMVIPTPVHRPVHHRFYLLLEQVRQHAISTAVFLSNALITVFQRSRPIILFATDPWYRLEPFIKNMPDVELIMSRRKEMREMGWRHIWRARARFHHRLDFVDANTRALAKKSAQDIIRQWHALGDTPALSNLFSYQEMSFLPIAKDVLDSLIVRHTEDAIATIENTKRLLMRYRVNCVLVRISTKGYENIIARVAEKMDIPSIELQHAFSPVEPSHPYARLPARYLASYGAFTQRVYEKFGVDPARVISIGSPRFDAYATTPSTEELEALRRQLRLNDDFLNVLVAVPYLFSALELYTFTSYAVRETLEDFSELQKKIPNLRFLLRPKPGPFRKSFYNREETFELFSAETRMVQFDNLRMLFGVSNFVISGNSALVLEAMLAHKPVIMYLPRKDDRDFQEFENAGAVLTARDQEELFRHTSFLTDQKNRATLVDRADIFLNENFMLDGKSSERIAALLRKVKKITLQSTYEK